MKTYIYKGEGVGLPGLPNEVTDEQAEAIGMGDTLKLAVQIGLYEEKKEPVRIQKSKVELKGSKGDVNDG